ncbi:MAG: type II toxin-antitoxin system VapC family toxin [Cuniculiplasma sp.]
MIFIDTSVLVAYIVEKDSNHEKAVSLMEEIIKGKHGSAITSEYVFDETVTVVLVRSKSLESAIMSGELIKESVPILDVSSSIFEASWGRFQRQQTTRFSFTDCTILELVEANHVENLATFDREFTSSHSFKVVG